jgi:hypothetical protein
MCTERILTIRSVELLGQVAAEGRHVFVIFVYLWALFSLFAIHKGIIVRDGMISGQVLALVNAFVLAKVMFIAARFGFSELFHHRPLIYPVIFKSAAFSVLLLAFYVAEETGIGMLRGETLAESFPSMGGGSATGLIVAVIILFIVLIPFFAFQELGRTIGSEVLRDIFFKSSSNTPGWSAASPVSGVEIGRR